MKRISTAVALVLALSGVAFAHGGAPHIQATVVSASDTTLVVKTKAGKTETLMLDASTRVMRGKKRVALQDVKEGDRVVVHPTKHGDHLLASPIDLPAAAAAKAPAKK
jgi:hypothetical protein